VAIKSMADGRQWSVPWEEAIDEAARATEAAEGLS
jgi:hypothetical protein